MLIYTELSKNSLKDVNWVQMFKIETTATGFPPLSTKLKFSPSVSPPITATLQEHKMMFSPLYEKVHF